MKDSIAHIVATTTTAVTRLTHKTIQPDLLLDHLALDEDSSEKNKLLMKPHQRHMPWQRVHLPF